MFISLVNPHDICVYPAHDETERGSRPDTGARTSPISASSCRRNYADDLSTKPKIQKLARDAYDKSRPSNSAEARGDYVNFYAYLHTVVDKHITKVLDTLDETRPARQHHHHSDSPTTARAAFRMACARRHTRSMRK